MVVHLHAVGRTRLLAFAHLDNLILQAALGYFHAIAQRVLGKELLALCLRVAIFEVVHRVLYILACRLHSELTIKPVHTVHKTLLNQFKVSSQRRLAQQSFCLLLLDTLANLLAHVH